MFIVELKKLFFEKFRKLKKFKIWLAFIVDTVLSSLDENIKTNISSNNFFKGLDYYM